MPPRTVLSAQRVALLRPALDGLLQQVPWSARLTQDPLHFPLRYAAPADQEVAAVLASALAFGRVSAFWPVLEQWFAWIDQRGGPSRYVDQFGAQDAAQLSPVIYRWLRGPHLALFARTLGENIRRHGRLGAQVEGAMRARHAHVGVALGALISSLRNTALFLSSSGDYLSLPRPFRTLLSTPSEGSACKRWSMLMRWMVRRPEDPGPDLGLWALDPAKLVIPLDTHVLRLSWYLGLTRRTDGSWRTAVEVSRNLRRIHPRDPMRYDFALAHLGISGACTARWDPRVCPGCPLVTACRMAR